MHILSPLLAMSLFTGLLALICPWYGVQLYRKWERWLSDQIQAVKDIAFRPREEKPPPVGLASLPAPVLRFFERSLRDDRPFRMWTARQVGELRFDAKSKWKPIQSQTVAAVGEPAFCFTGTMQMGPGEWMWCRGREGYMEGKGGMEWRLWGVVRLAKLEGPQLDQCALVRYLAEAVCFPRALLPSRHLKWVASPVEPHTCATAVLSFAGSAVAATFTFDSLDRVREVRSNDYYRAQPGGRMVRTPWFARASGYMRFGLGGAGIEIPTSLQVGWVEPDGSEFVYGKFTVAGVHAE